MTLEKSHDSKVPSNRLSLQPTPSNDTPGYPFYENREAMASAAIAEGVRRNSAAGGEQVPHPNRPANKTMPTTGQPGELCSVVMKTCRQKQFTHVQ